MITFIVPNLTKNVALLTGCVKFILINGRRKIVISCVKNI